MKIIECPRDAMQGIKDFIPTHKKAEYINQLLQVGFHTIDFGSFVSASVIPQLKDTEKVLGLLDLDNTNSKLLTIIGNLRGGNIACNFDAIDYLGFPLSISERFQKRNTNKSISEAINVVGDLQNLCIRYNKKMVVYLSMAFGNPYSEKYHPDIVALITDKLNNLGVEIIALADTIGISEPSNISPLFNLLISEYPNIEFGAHFHSKPHESKKKIESAYQSGCRRFDTTIKGYGGCPMAEDELTGNISTEDVISFCSNNNIDLTLDTRLFNNIVEKMSIYF